MAMPRRWASRNHGFRIQDQDKNFPRMISGKLKITNATKNAWVRRIASAATGDTLINYTRSTFVLEKLQIVCSGLRARCGFELEFVFEKRMS
jgi:hypothetical protein